MMTKYAWKKLVTQCIAEVITEEGQPEPYDAKTDAFSPGPRDRTEPVKQDIPAQMARQSLYRQIRQAEAARKIKPKSWEELDAMTSGDLQKYYNQIGNFDSSVHVPGVGWGGNPLKEANTNLNKLSNAERRQIHDAFKKAGVDGNGRFEKKEHGQRMDGPTHQYPNSPSKFEIQAYAS